MKTVTITLTPDDIINGVPNHYKRCAVARAIKRTLHLGCSVGNKSVTLSVLRWPVHYCTLPTEVTRFIRTFDRGIVGPHYQLSFPLSLPDHLTYLARIFGTAIPSQVAPSIETEPPADDEVVEEEEELVEVG